MALPRPFEPPVTIGPAAGQPEVHLGLAGLRRPRPRRRSPAACASASLSRLCRGGQNTSTSRQWLSVVQAPCGTQAGMTATSPLRIVRTSPSRSKVNSPSRTMTICSSSWTCRGRLGAGLEAARSWSWPAGRAPAGTRARARTRPASARRCSRTGRGRPGSPSASVVKWLAASPSDCVVHGVAACSCAVAVEFREAVLQHVADPADALVDEIVGDPAVGQPDLVGPARRPGRTAGRARRRPCAARAAADSATVSTPSGRSPR